MSSRLAPPSEIVWVGAHPTPITTAGTSGVLLDPEVTSALVTEAFDTNVIAAVRQGRSEYEKGFLLANRQHELAMVALQQLVLYGKIWLAGSFDNFDVTPLVETGLVAVAEFPTSTGFGGPRLNGT